MIFLPKNLKLWVNSPHGRGLVLCAESFAFDNTMMIVINETDGKMRHYDITDLRVCQDFTDEINVKDVKPKRAK